MDDLLFEHQPEHREFWIARIRRVPDPEELTAVYLNILETCLGRQRKKARPENVAYYATRTVFAGLREAEWRKRRPPGRVGRFEVMAQAI